MKTSFFESYLWIWAFLFQIPMGAIPIILIHDLTGGEWGNSARPYLQRMVRTYWFFPITFIPLCFGLKTLYPWIHNSKYAWKTGFYNPWSFSVRSFIYFLLLALITRFILRTDRSKNKSALNLCLYVMSFSLMAIDWFMARDPEWISTTYALIWILSSATTSYAFFLVWRPKTIFDINRDHASLFIIFILMWCYLAFMQYLIVWSGNLPKEVHYYLIRFEKGWDWPIIFVTFGNFFIPFFLLLNKKIKRNGKRLSQIAILILVCRCIDTIWVLLPPTRTELSVSGFDLILPLVLVSAWYQLFKRVRQ